MAFEIDKNGNEIRVVLDGRLDATTAPNLLAALDEMTPLPDSAAITFDLAQVEYISSAGLRVLLAAYKRAAKAGGAAHVTNAQGEVRNVLDVSGFSDIFDIA